MALINCPECGHEVSSSAQVCIFCGFPLQQQIKTNHDTIGGKIVAIFEQFALVSQPRNNKLDEVYPTVKEAAASIRAENDIQVANGRIANEILEGLSKVTPYCNWMNVKMFCELFCFDNISNDAMHSIIEKLYKLISVAKVSKDGSISRPNIIPFYYPLYLSVQYADESDKARLMEILNENFLGQQTAYEYICYKYAQVKGQSGLQQLSAYNSQNVKAIIKCPVCGSIDVKRISTAGRVASIVTFGLASSKIGKQYECKKCKHKW